MKGKREVIGVLDPRQLEKLAARGHQEGRGRAARIMSDRRQRRPKDAVRRMLHGEE